MELEDEGAPISVTLIKPSAIDTPYKHHAKNYMDVEPDNPPPVYAPEVVGEARRRGVGAELTTVLGGVRDRRFSEPLTVTARVAGLFDARFVLSGPEPADPTGPA